MSPRGDTQVAHSIHVRQLMQWQQYDEYLDILIGWSLQLEQWVYARAHDSGCYRVQLYYQEGESRQMYVPHEWLQLTQFLEYRDLRQMGSWVESNYRVYRSQDRPIRENTLPHHLLHNEWFLFQVHLSVDHSVVLHDVTYLQDAFIVIRSSRG